MAILEKHYFLATIDGDDPERWTPYPNTFTNLAALSKYVSDWSAKITMPTERIIRIRLSLIPKKSLFDNRFDRVVGLLIDGSTLLDGNAHRSEMEERLEIVIRKIVAENKFSKIFGIGLYPLFDSLEDALWHEIHTSVDRIARLACGEISYNINCLPSLEILKHQLKSELVRVRIREPFADLEIG